MYSPTTILPIASFIPSTYHTRMNTSGHETESAANGVSTTTSPSVPNLQGPTIFVYVVSTLMGIAAGGFIALTCWSNHGEIFNWPDFLGYVALSTGPLVGWVAARFGLKLMMHHIYNQSIPLRIVIFGTLWGLLAGWIASIILWLIVGFFSIPYKYFWPEIPVAAGFGIAFFGTIGGLGAGVVCGGVWAIWYQKQKRS